MKRLVLSCGVMVALSMPVAAQTTDLQASVALFQKVRTVPNIVYLRVNGWEGKLDVYAQRPGADAHRHLHPRRRMGAGHEGSQRADGAAVPRDGLLGGQRRVPAGQCVAGAGGDRRLPMRAQVGVGHAKDYNFDPERLIIAGPSAGGHLALTTGMVPRAPGSIAMSDGGRAQDRGDRQFLRHHRRRRSARRPGKKPFPEAGPTPCSGSATSRTARKSRRPRRRSPTCAPACRRRSRFTATPIPSCRIRHSVRLHDALQKAGIPHELITIPGGGHGNFTPDQWQRAYAAIEKFLAAHVPASKPPSSAGR